MEPGAPGVEPNNWGSVFSGRRRLAGRELIVAGNFSGEVQHISIHADWPSAELVIGNYPPPATPHDDTLILRPWEALVFRTTGPHETARSDANDRSAWSTAR